MGSSVQEIVYAFLQSYYERLKENPSKLSNFYGNTAELTHINYQQIDYENTDFVNDILPTVKLTGKENINKFFTRNEEKVSDLKLKLDSCDFQTTGVGHKGIIIIVTGELFWSKSPVYKFCQTFILTPISRNNEIYDVSNDIIRFISCSLKEVEIISKPQEESLDDKIVESLENVRQTNDKAAQIDESVMEKNNKEDDEEEEIEEEINETKKTTKPKKEENKGETKNGHHKSKSKSVNEHDNHDEKKAKQNSSLTENSNKSNEDTTTTNEHDKTDEPTRKEIGKQIQEKNEESKPINKETDKETVPVTMTKMSWASKLSSNESIPKESRKTIVSREDNMSRSDSSRSKKNTNNKTKDEDKKSDRRENGNNKNKKKNSGNTSNANKEGFYPIYINGTENIRDDSLKNLLIKEFGPVMKMTSGENFAVVDFQLESSQREAIEKKKLIIEDVEISLERKTSKKSSSTQSNFTNTQRGHKKSNSGKDKKSGV